MDKESLYKSVHRLREGIASGWLKRHQHKELDNIVHNVLGDDEVDNIETLEQDLADHIVRHIMAVKKAKENEKFQAKARGIIEQIKAALEE